MINRPLPEPDSSLVGYAALIDKYGLSTTLPHTLAVISSKHKNYTTDGWRIFTPRHACDDTISAHLAFALKYEGVDLAIFSNLFANVPKSEIEQIIRHEPSGSYARRIWFLYEWLRDESLDVPDAQQEHSIALLDAELQYVGPSRLSKRHRVRNNLPGVRNFCPLIKRTKKLDDLIAMDLQTLVRANTGSVHSDVLMRAAAFLLLEDSKASYAIEGETPPHNRAERWARVIGKAGQSPLSLDELERLQKEVIVDNRFTHMGYRKEGGFIGTHDRSTGMPIPDHISARADNLGALMTGLINTTALLKEGYPPVLAAAAIAFGFVFIHPFEDGNGRLHRYLLHHVLAETGFTPKGIVFPVSSVILEITSEYRSVLENYSKPILPYIKWRATEKNNVEVLNETIDFYRYFDATAQAEFFYECVYKTITEALPNEVDYLQKYDKIKSFVSNYIEMPDLKIDLLINFLHQNHGIFSVRARTKEFAALKDEEVQVLENKYKDIFDA